MGMGFEYGHGGPSHYALEDVAALRTLPGLTIVIPADSPQTSTALTKTYDLPGPIYYSLGKDDRTLVPGLDGRFELGRAQVVRTGDDIAIVTMGSIAQEAVAAAADLASRGINATVVVVSSFNPDPEDDLTEILGQFRNVISLEAQTISGGLAACVGSADRPEWTPLPPASSRGPRFAGWHHRQSGRPMAKIWTRPRQYCFHSHGGARTRTCMSHRTGALNLYR